MEAIAKTVRYLRKAVQTIKFNYAAGLTLRALKARKILF